MVLVGPVLRLGILPLDSDLHPFVYLRSEFDDQSAVEAVWSLVANLLTDLLSLVGIVVHGSLVRMSLAAVVIAMEVVVRTDVLRDVVYLDLSLLPLALPLLLELLVTRRS